MAVTPMPDTGHGATITFGSTAWSGKLRGIPTNLQITRPRVDKSHLGTSGQREYMPGDLEELGEITLDVLFEQGRGLPATGTVPETITLTYPLNPSDGSASAATTAGTGFITGTQQPAMQTGQEMVGQITFTFDGGTGPTFTAAS